MDKKNSDLIKVVNMSKKLNGKYLLKNVNIAIKKGEFVVLLGPNGAGKSTLIKCLSGLYRIDEGSIFVDGIEWTKKSEQKIKQMISYIPDKANFDLNLSIEQNLIHHAALYGIPQNETISKLDKLFDLFDLTDKRNVSINKLSFGMQKKALIIRGLLSSPSILIFDEPTMGLDPKAKKDLMDEIFKLHSLGITVILSTQSLQVANQSNKIIYIEDGLVKDLNVEDKKIDWSKETLLISFASIDSEREHEINEGLKQIEGVREIQSTAVNVRINIENTPEVRINCISKILEYNLMIYTIEFENSSYMSLYEKR